MADKEEQVARELDYEGWLRDYVNAHGEKAEVVTQHDVQTLRDFADWLRPHLEPAAAQPETQYLGDGITQSSSKIDSSLVEISSSPAPSEPQIKMGFIVKVNCHTQQALDAITSPEALRFMIGHMMDSWKLQEEIDYTLEVGRTYEQV